MPRANWSVLRDYPVPLPPSELLQRFDNAVLDCAHLAATLHGSNRRLAASRDLLLPRLISGDLPVIAAEATLERAA
jgi:type I restriction enzyme S subunit